MKKTDTFMGAKIKVDMSLAVLVHGCLFEIVLFQKSEKKESVCDSLVSFFFLGDNCIIL